MEILAELVFWLLGLLGELLLQVVFEVLAEFGLRSLGEPFRRTRDATSPWLATLGYTIYGAIAGGLSLLVFPLAVLQNPVARIANLAITPLLSGLAMSLMGAWRRRRGDDLIRLDRFSYGVMFALAMALVRYFFADPG